MQYAKLSAGALRWRLPAALRSGTYAPAAIRLPEASISSSLPRECSHYTGVGAFLLAYRGGWFFVVVVAWVEDYVFVELR